MILVGGYPVLGVDRFDPGNGVVMMDSAASGTELGALAETDEIVWFTGRGPRDLTAVVGRAEAAGIANQRLVLEPDPSEIGLVTPTGIKVACAPDRFGLVPGGPLEAAVSSSVIHGAELVRTQHVLVARRCMDVSLALLFEREGAGT